MLAARRRTFHLVPARSKTPHHRRLDASTPRRLANGYRDYDPYLIDRAIQIRGLIDSGIPTKIITLILPCLDQPRGIVPEDIEPELLAILRAERDRMTQRIDFLTRNQDSIATYIDTASAALHEPVAEAV